jgi:hypothetical protein
MKLLTASLIFSLIVLGHARAEERFACNLKALTPAERAHHMEVSKKLLGATEARRELPNGYAFQFPATDWMLAAEWVSLERRCCPFFHFSLQQPRDGGPLQLEITGSDGVKQFIRSEFGF